MEKSPKTDSYRIEPFRTPRVERKTVPSRYKPHSESAALHRQRTSQFTPLSRSTTFCSDAGDDANTRWTRNEWKKLEHYYIKNKRDYKHAGEAFYMNESLQRVDGNKLEEKWTKEHCIWRSQCLDTNAKFNQGLLPSERKKKLKLQKKTLPPK